MLLALLDAPWKAGAVLVLYIAIQQFESLVLVPLIMKQEVDMMPVFTILAVVIFASFFGFLGLFLTIPLLIAIQICLKEVLVKDVLNKWQGDQQKIRDKKIFCFDKQGIVVTKLSLSSRTCGNVAEFSTSFPLFRRIFKLEPIESLSN
jgi:hypothetical protein